ncbi:MAG: hypothetical protein ACI9OJ_004653 [Myxococcota bacterium]|jgi:hypothetical protein
MRRLALVAALLVPFPAIAFSINSGFSNGCHERLTVLAYQRALLDLPLNNLVPPEDDTWREFAIFLAEQIGGSTQLASSDVSDADQFLILSLVVGVRAPDTDGHSILNLTNLRELHSDPSPEGQYAHALRGPDDDEAAGDATAVEGTRARIIDLLDEATRLLQLPDSEQIIMGTAYLDFYGRFEMTVHGPTYYLGQAMHALQDSFSHSIRDEAGGYRQVVHVMNYVEAISGEIVERRDGLAHSDSMDDCDGEPGEVGGTVDAAVDASADLLLTFRTIALSRDRDAVTRFLDKWVTLKEDCTFDNAFCGNDRWLAVTRIAQTEPYLESIFSCSAGRGSSGKGAVFVLMFLAVGLLAAARMTPNTTR